jgi:uncharacterized protein (TIGR03067 family)
VLVLAAGLLVAAEGRQDPAKNERDRLQGYWNVVKAEQNRLKDSKGLKHLQLVFTGKKLTFARPDKSRHIAEYKLGAGKKPKTMDFTFITGPDESKTFKGIYHVKGDHLKLCWAESGQKRPRAFKEGAKSGCTLLHLKRGKP